MLCQGLHECWEVKDLEQLQRALEVLSSQSPPWSKRTDLRERSGRLEKMETHPRGKS